MVRLHNWRDEPFGDRHVAAYRISEYQAGTIPFNSVLGQEEVLRRVIDLLRAAPDQSAEAQDHRLHRVASGVQRRRTGASRLHADYGGAGSKHCATTALANVSFYLVVPSRVNLYGGGLVAFTGGQVFATTYNVGPAIDRIMQDASYHYVLGYWPPKAARANSIRSSSRSIVAAPRSSSVHDGSSSREPLNAASRRSTPARRAAR